MFAWKIITFVFNAEILKIRGNVKKKERKGKETSSKV